MPGKVQKAILIAEDSFLTRFHSKRILEEHGYAVDVAADGREALVKVAERLEPYDLVIIDIYMPGMDGLEFLEKLRLRPEYAHVPVMMLTADGKISSVKRAAKLGAVDYLVKPFNEDTLVRRVEKIIGPGEKEAKTPSELLQKLLRAEVNRARRGNLKLALVVARSRKAEGQDVAQIEKYLKRRLREIDTVLGLKKGSVALVLPLTGKEGAAIVVNKLKNWLPGEWDFVFSVFPDDSKSEEELYNYVVEAVGNF